MNEKLAGWAGFRQLSKGVRGFHYERGEKIMNWMPPGETEWFMGRDRVPHFTDSLDACFEWLVPKLRREGEYPYLTEIIIDPTMCDEEMYYCYLRYDSLHDDGCIEGEESQGSAITPSLAFCNAVIGMIK